MKTFQKVQKILRYTLNIGLIFAHYHHNINYNQYNGLSTQEKFQLISIDGKTKTNMDFEKWKNTWSQYNNGINSEQNSCYLSVDGILNEVDDGAYSLTINTNELLLPYISRTDIIDDYFSKVWNISNCVAGPFTDLSNKCLQLNKAFISNQ